MNSPNDLVYKSDGSLYFTDPPFGLPKFYDDSRKQLPFSGVFRVSPDGKEVQLVTKDLNGPNGLAFSPDEKYFYVDNWDDKKKIIMRYEVNADGALSNGKVFFDMTSAPGVDALDGMKIDKKGNLYVSGRGDCGSFHREADISVRSSVPNIPITWRGGTMTARPSIFAPKRVCIAYA